MPERSSSIRMSRRSSLAGFRRSVTENPETSELLPTQWEGGLDAICILVGPKMSDPPLEGGVVWIQLRWGKLRMGVNKRGDGAYVK